MLPEKSPQHQDIFLPWARKIAQASNGRLRVNVTAAMQLGGKPAELITQVEGHQVDIVWTLPGFDEDLRKVLDAHSGAALSAELGRMWDDIEEIGREDFAAGGGVVTFVKNDDYDAWVEASQTVNEAWKAKVGRAGIDGGKLIAAAKELVAKYTERARHN